MTSRYGCRVQSRSLGESCKFWNHQDESGIHHHGSEGSWRREKGLVISGVDNLETAFGCLEPQQPLCMKKKSLYNVECSIIIMNTHLHSVRHCSKCLIYFELFYPQNNPMR